MFYGKHNSDVKHMDFAAQENTIVSATMVDLNVVCIRLLAKAVVVCEISREGKKKPWRILSKYLAASY